MLADLDDKELDMVISYIRSLSAEGRKKRLVEQEVMSEKERIDGIVDSLVGILPDDGTTLEDIRTERLF